MRTPLMIAAATAAALLAGSAYAQTAAAAGDTAVNPPAASADATASAGDANVSAASAAQAERAPATTVGGTDLVSNGPVPDTPENRAKYGKPMSHAGRQTQPAGN